MSRQAEQATRDVPRRIAARLVLTRVGPAAVLLVTAWSAAIVKETGRTPPPLVEVRASEPAELVSLGAPAGKEETTAVRAEAGAEFVGPPEPSSVLALDPTVRWFNGRPVRPARDITMLVTAYSPDARSCGDSDDGLTATMHPVETNGHALIAADPELLPYGSMLTVPGYDHDRIVPVLDCGGAIKGRHIDVLFPTHDAARQWGKQKLRVTVWEYADGLPPENPRKVR